MLLPDARQQGGPFPADGRLWLSLLQKAWFAIPGPALPRRNLFCCGSLGFGLVLVSCLSKEVMSVCGLRVRLSEGLIAHGSDRDREQAGVNKEGQAQAH